MNDPTLLMIPHFVACLAVSSIILLVIYDRYITLVTTYLKSQVTIHRELSHQLWGEMHICQLTGDRKKEDPYLTPSLHVVNEYGNWRIATREQYSYAYKYYHAGGTVFTNEFFTATRFNNLAKASRVRYQLELANPQYLWCEHRPELRPHIFNYNTKPWYMRLYPLTVYNREVTRWKDV